jgi:hypothetical protein
MCDECFAEDIDSEKLINTNYIKITNHFRINTDKFHCLTGPARTFVSKNKIYYYWYVDDIWIHCFSQKEFESSKEYRVWKLKAFT